MEDITSQIIEKKNRGRPIGSYSNKIKYRLTWKENEYLCKDYDEISKIVKKSKYCIGRLMRNENTFKKKEICKDLLDIKITKL